MEESSKNEINKPLISRIAELEKENDRKLSGVQKILLTTDGSITAILDVLYGKIDLDTLSQHFASANLEQAKLVDANVGDELNFREVLLNLRGKPLMYAASEIPLSRCSEGIAADLMRADIPIGRILKNHQVESRRRINGIYVEKPNEKLQKIFHTDEDMLARDYAIISGGNILMWIKEVFPISYFL
ncbi:MAG: chorismate pyruvate-lyase family protein [Fibrobacter sp.]|nr:chorismate pyruvate-lyase family protein [Fibrobacter sp.]